MTCPWFARSLALCSGVLLLPVAGVVSATAQVEFTIEGGVHAARLDRPERALEQPARGISLQGAAGEATTFGLRAGAPLHGRWYLDGGLAWSRNTSAQGTVGGTAPDLQTHTLFTSATIQARLTGSESRLGLRAGVGPALILHRGGGSSLLARQTDFGALVTVGGDISLDGRLGLRLDAQQYLFSSRFAGPYTPALVGAPTQPAGSRFRHEFVLLAGFSWRTH